MVPLIIVEMKIISCSDPMAMFSGFGPKVLLMHFCFLFLRVLCYPFAQVGLSFYGNVFSLCAAFIVLRMGFNLRCTVARVYEHLDVLALVLMALAAASLTEFIDAFLGGLPLRQKLLPCMSAASD